MSEQSPRDPVAYFAKARPDKVACVDLDRGSQLSFREFDVRANRIAAMLERVLGERVVGARVATLARNSSDLLCLYLACGRIGAIYAPLNWRLSGPELCALVRAIDVQALFFDREFAAAVSVMSEGAPGALFFDMEADFPRELNAAAEMPATQHARRNDDVTTLLCTSGTTGAPKAVMVTETNAVATAINYAMAAEVSSASVLLCEMPMFHVVGLFAMARTALQYGATLLIGGRFEADQTARRIADPALGVTHYFCAPQMAQQMRRSSFYDAAAFSRLTALQTGGAPHSAEDVRAWLDDGVRLVDGFGMSEAGTVLGMPPGDLDLLRRKAGAAGLPGLLTDVRLVTKEGRDADIGEAGEIWVRGPSVTPGYWRNDAATQAAFSDGWLKSGDAARCDSDGFYVIVDRWKDMYVSGGENVYPVEVEAVLAKCPGVQEVAVVGVADARWGETGVAFVVKQADAALAAAELVAFCRQHLAAYKAPKHVVFVETLPRTASGKVQKAVLRAHWAELLKGQTS